MSDQTMAGRTVLVTGASDGIGAETARVLAAKGATVHVTGRSADKLRPVAEAVGTEPLVADFSRLDDVRRLADQVGERVETLDLLMNNAGGTFAPVEEDPRRPRAQLPGQPPGAVPAHQPAAPTAGGGRRVAGGQHLQHRQPDGQDRARRPRLRAPPGDRVPGLRHRQADEHRLHPRHRPALVRRRRRLGRRPPRPGGSSFGRDSWFVGLAYRSPLKRFATISVPDGAAPLIALAERGPDPEINGRYFSRFKADGRENKQAHDQSVIDGLWERSAALVGLQG